MRENWKFSELEYVRPDFEQAKENLKSYIKKIREADSFTAALSAYTESEKEIDHLMMMYTLVYVRHTLDTSDKFYEEEHEVFNSQFPTFGPISVESGEALNESKYRDDFETKFGKQFFASIELEKKRFSEKNIPLLQEEAKLTSEYQKMMASCKIKFDGKELNLYGIQKYFENDDREVRKAAFQAYSDFYYDNEKRLEEIWDELIKLRNEMGRNLGFENFIPLGYLRQSRTDYGQKEVASFRKQVEGYLVPLCTELYKAQAKRIGVDPLYVFDEKMTFADGNAVPAGDDDFMMEEAKKMYHELSPETAEFIDFMMEHELLDLKNKPNKASTGYMTSLAPLKAPFVFSCFNGTIFDMQVLTHELGHAFAGYMAMRNQPISEYYSESTDIAEIHSMSMEQFAYPYAERFFGKDADKYRFQHLQDAITFVPFGVAVDEFQHICYEKPELTPKERTYEWHKLEEKYMPWRKYDEADEFMNRGGYWYHKLHIIQHPMYYINYTLTTMGAMEFKKKYAEDKEKAWEDYLKLCKVGGSLSYLETLKYANVSNPFEAGSVEKSCSYAKEILEETIKSGKWD